MQVTVTGSNASQDYLLGVNVTAGSSVSQDVVLTGTKVSVAVRWAATVKWKLLTTWIQNNGVYSVHVATPIDQSASAIDQKGATVDLVTPKFRATITNSEATDQTLRAVTITDLR